MTYLRGGSLWRGRGCLAHIRGGASDSDIDILVDYDGSARLSLLKICGMMTDLEDLPGKKVDLVENGRMMDLFRELRFYKKGG